MPPQVHMVFASFIIYKKYEDLFYFLCCFVSKLKSKPATYDNKIANKSQHFHTEIVEPCEPKCTEYIK